MSGNLTVFFFFLDWSSKISLPVDVAEGNICWLLLLLLLQKSGVCIWAGERDRERTACFIFAFLCLALQLHFVYYLVYVFALPWHKLMVQGRSTIDFHWLNMEKSAITIQNYNYIKSLLTSGIFTENRHIYSVKLNFSVWLNIFYIF